MVFSPYTYYSNLFAWVLVYLAVLTLLLICLLNYRITVLKLRRLKKTILRWKDHKGIEGFVQKAKVIILALIALSFVQLTVRVVRISRYWFPLLAESSTDVREVSGTIEQINAAPINRPVSEYQGVSQSPSIVQVGSKELLFLQTGKLKIGDYVSVAYLNRSNTVVSWSVGTAEIPSYTEVFDSSFYIRRTLVTYSFTLLIIGVFLLLGGISVFIPQKKSIPPEEEEIYKKKSTRLIHLVMCAVGIVLLCVLSFSDLRRGLLSYMNATPYKKSTGIINEIDTTGCIARYSINGEETKGCYIEVSGTRFYTIFNENLKEGTYVELTYNPKSNIANVWQSGAGTLIDD